MSISTMTPRIKVPVLIVWFYGMFCVSLVPWMVYLWHILPAERTAMPWRVIWVVFDTILLSQGFVAFWLLHKRSPWASLPLTALAALFVADIWFDIMTSVTNAERTTAVLIAVLTEIPLIILSLSFAIYIFRQAIGASKNGLPPKTARS